MLLDLDARDRKGRGDDERVALGLDPGARFPEVADVDQGNQLRLRSNRERHVRTEAVDAVLAEQRTTGWIDGDAEVVGRELSLRVVGEADARCAHQE